MTKAEIIQEIRRRTCQENYWPKNDHLYDLIHDASGIGDSFYHKHPDLLLNIAAQIVRVLEEEE